MQNSDATPVSLLMRLRTTPDDETAWRMFADRYGRMMRGWCRRWGLQDSDADDVTQNVLLELAKQLRHFEYQPGGRFRSWLKTVVYRAWCDFQTRRRPDRGSGDSTVQELLTSVEAGDDLCRAFEEESDRELLEEAMRRVQARVQPHTWQAFRLLAQDGLSGEAVAEQLGMKVGTVYVARFKVQKMLQDEIRHLNGPLESHE